MHDDTETENLSSTTADNPIEEPALADGSPVDSPFHPTRTYYELLAEEILGDIEKLAAKIPKLEAHQRASRNAIRAHSNVPRPFLGTAIVVREDTPELVGATLVPEQGRETLQLLDAFRVVDDRIGALKDDVHFNLMSRRTVLAVQALQVYSMTRSLARTKRDTKAAAHVENLKRDLGKRGRPKKKRGEEAV
ncbi:MAG TPA: hypothetical protein VFV49_03950 [Thermoanaerobaculia bacterium]|nr:hypothetical protein [Thermoanaerobaculia bacterium]